MKKINCFLIFAFTFLLITNHTNATTTNSLSTNDIKSGAYLIPAFTNNALTANESNTIKEEISEFAVASSSSSEVITSNITRLYSICIALVLFNLIVQIKIIFQMVHLFFQFRKKDEFATFNFQ